MYYSNIALKVKSDYIVFSFKFKKSCARRKVYFLLLMLILSISLGCNSGESTKGNNSKDDLSTTSIVKENLTYELKKVNFYLENSLSMKGYLKGDNFKRNIRRLTRKKDDYTVDAYFANVELIPEKNIWGRIQKNNIKQGNENSDTGFILKEAIKNQSDSIITIVVTEGIYSTDLSNGVTLDVDIEEYVENALSVKDFDTVIIKCSSYFDGIYYIEDKSCSSTKPISLQQDRPYYIFIFGTPELINSYLSSGVSINDLDGKENALRFNTRKDQKIAYTILSRGSEKKGRFKSGSKYFGIVHEIIGAEAKRGNTSDEFQFAVALDFSELKSLSEDFLIDKSNYTITSKYPYEIIGINSINDISSQANTQIEKYKKEGYDFTHFMVLKAKKSAISGDITIELNKEIPEWATNTGLDSDCAQYIKGNAEQTYTFDKVIKGLSKAYNYNETKNYFSIRLTIKI